MIGAVKRSSPIPTGTLGRLCRLQSKHARPPITDWRLRLVVIVIGSNKGRRSKPRYTATKKIDLQAIVSEYYPALYRFGLALTKNESEAADLTQQTFLVLAEHQEQVREPERIKCWLFTTLRREFFRKVRIDRAHPELEFLPEEHQVQTLEPSALRFSDFRTTLAALQKLEESYRSVLELFYLGDLSYEEISPALGVPIGTVMSRLSRGKEQLRRVLGTALGGDAQKDHPLSKKPRPGGLR